MFNNVQSLKVSNTAFFQRGQPMLLVKKGIFFLYLFSVKIRLEIMFYVTKKPFLAIKNSDFQSPKNRKEISIFLCVQKKMNLLPCQIQELLTIKASNDRTCVFRNSDFTL